MKLNDRSDNVRRWKEFLIGQGSYWLITDGADADLFDDNTVEATKNFQYSMYLEPDGVVGNNTLNIARQLGFVSEPKKEFQQNPLTYQERLAKFGQFKFVSAPTKSNPEAIQIESNWVHDNIVTITVPLFDRSILMSCNKRVSHQFAMCFEEWHDLDLSQKIITFDGAYAPRFVRGSRQYLSNHSWGTAFDINASYNRLGAVPVALGKLGSVRELVPVAEKHGFFWGGNFSRVDGMHFEIARLL